MPLASLHFRLNWVALAAILMFALESQGVTAATRVITDADNGGSVQLKMGDILEVHLRANPTTGYKWYVHPKSTRLLRLVGQSQTQVREPGVGRPILQVFRFQAVAIGDGVLLLHYIRAWERHLSYEEQYSVRISIR
jgi:predicted secreted protein